MWHPSTAKAYEQDTETLYLRIFRTTSQRSTDTRWHWRVSGRSSGVLVDYGIASSIEQARHAAEECAKSNALR